MSSDSHQQAETARATGTTRKPVRRKSRIIEQPPRGLRYVPEFVARSDEQALIAEIERLPFEPVRMYGVEARRQVVHFGVGYTFEGRGVVPAPSIPEFLTPLCARAAAQARFPAGARIEALVTRYPNGAGIGWHRDAPPFGPAVAGISLVAACAMRFRLQTPSGYDVYKQILAPRSLYVFSGSARFRWQHMIPPVDALRYSITFRTVRRGAG